MPEYPEIRCDDPECEPCATATGPCPNMAPPSCCDCEKCQGKTVDRVTWGEYMRRLSEPSAGGARSRFYDMITQAVTNRRSTAPDRIFEYNPEPLVAADLEAPPPVAQDIPITRIVTPYGTLNMVANDAAHMMGLRADDIIVVGGTSHRVNYSVTSPSGQLDVYASPCEDESEPQGG